MSLVFLNLADMIYTCILKFYSVFNSVSLSIKGLGLVNMFSLS